jgi:dipeptide/tripeptide permease
MDISGRVSGFVRQLALSAGLGIIVLAIVLTGIGFLVTALSVYVGQHFPPAQAAAVTGFILIALAMLIAGLGSLILKKTKKQRPSLLSEFGSTVGLATRLIGMLVRRDPKKAIILAAVSGAIAEYVMSDTRK